MPIAEAVGDPIKQRASLHGCAAAFHARPLGSTRKAFVRGANDRRINPRRHATKCPGPRAAPADEGLGRGFDENLAKLDARNGPRVGNFGERISFGLNLTLRFELGLLNAFGGAMAVRGVAAAARGIAVADVADDVMRGPGRAPRIVSPPGEGQVRMGGFDNVVLEGHGRALEGSFKLPEGTWLRIPVDRAIPDSLGQRIAARGNWPSDIPSVLFGPGEAVPNFVLGPPINPTLAVRARSWTVTRPTLLSDMVEANMGMCYWAACR